MKIKYSFSRWNDLTSKTQYNRTPTIAEIKKANSEKRIITKDNLIIFGWGDGAEVRTVVGNSLSVNRYSDVYSIIN